MHTCNDFITSDSWAAVLLTAWACSSMESLRSWLRKDTSSDITPSPFKSLEPSCRLVCTKKSSILSEPQATFLGTTKHNKRNQFFDTSAFSRIASVAPASFKSKRCSRSWARAYIGVCKWEFHLVLQIRTSKAIDKIILAYAKSSW